MSSHDVKSAVRPDPDKLLVEIADYVTGYQIKSQDAYDTARYCLMDTLAVVSGAAISGMYQSDGPLVPGATLPAARALPGTSYELDPVHAAFTSAHGPLAGFHDTWLAANGVSLRQPGGYSRWRIFSAAARQ